MDSTIAETTGMGFEPAAVLFSDEKPQEARQLKEGKWGWVRFMLGGVGLGFGNRRLGKSPQLVGAKPRSRPVGTAGFSIKCCRV